MSIFFYHFCLIEGLHNWSENYSHLEFLSELSRSSGFKLQDHFYHSSWGGPKDFGSIILYLQAHMGLAFSWFSFIKLASVVGAAEGTH